MFENYQNISTSYTPNNYSNQNFYDKNIQHTIEQNKPFEVIDKLGNLTGYFWYYGNSVVLSFDIQGEFIGVSNDSYLDVSDVLGNTILSLTIYDSRHYVIHQENKKAIGTSVDFEISGELSKKMVKGKYYIQLNAINDNGYNETLFGSNSCTFEVR